MDTNVYGQKMWTVYGVSEHICLFYFFNIHDFLFTNTLMRNRNATLFKWKIHGLLFKMLDRDKEPSCFQEMVTNSTKHCLK